MKKLLLTLFLCSCNPAERQIAEEIVEEVIIDEVKVHKNTPALRSFEIKKKF